jgi:hypothetical protein
VLFSYYARIVHRPGQFRQELPLDSVIHLPTYPKSIGDEVVFLAIQQRFQQGVLAVSAPDRLGELVDDSYYWSHLFKPLGFSGAAHPLRTSLGADRVWCPDASRQIAITGTVPFIVSSKIRSDVPRSTKSILHRLRYASMGIKKTAQMECFFNLSFHKNQ